MDGGYGTSQMPLAGAILCCTAIPPEERAALANIGAQMGATIKLDLTSDVTHLLVGNVDSAKYRYVAKSREDVKVLNPEWLEALRLVWMDGGEVDAAALENEYRLPAFHSLKICLTGFDNPDQRKYIQESAMRNGAEYHGDLTKNVTHLIAANPSGKKYEHAVNWRLKIVTWEWFEQSIQRGMALEERFYHPTMPVEERGKGAWDRRQSLSPTLGKRARDPEQAVLSNPHRRKLRRSASTKLGSQSEALWAGITAPGLERNVVGQDEWTEDTKTSLPGPDAPADSVAEVQDDALSEDPASQAPALLSNDGIFEGRITFAYAFDLEKTRILREHLAGNGAVAIEYPADLLRFSSEDLKRGFLVIPHDVKPDLTLLPGAAGAMALVTNWWVERCLHAKCLVDPTEQVLCKPFHRLAIAGFEGLTINSTAFTGIELLQVTKAVALMGATYDEYLTPKTSVLVCNTRNPNPDKFKFATDKRIQAVHASWLWQCLRTGELQPLEDHLLNTLPPHPQKARHKHQQPYSEVATAPLSEEDSVKLRKKKAQTAKAKQKPQSRQGQRTRTLDLTLSTDTASASTTASSTHPNTAGGLPFDEDEGVTPGVDGPSSLPLQDIHPSVNSPRRHSTSSNTSNSKSTAASTSTTGSISNLPHKPVTATGASEPVKDPKAGSEPVAPEKDYSSIMSNILAQRKAATEQTLNREDDTRKRRRQLGRARSNPSTADEALSKTGSAAAVLHPTSDAEIDSEALSREGTGLSKGKAPEYQPSQELGWDAPGAQEARERMIRAMGGTVENTGGIVEPVGVMKDAVRGETGIGLGRAGRRRRG